METEKLIVCVQCLGVNNKIGSFLRGTETKKQYTKTFNSCADLFKSLKYKQLKKTHKII